METIQLNNSGSAIDLFGKDVRVVFPKKEKEMLYAYLDLGWILTPQYKIYKNICNCREKNKCENSGKHPKLKFGKPIYLKSKEELDQWLGENEYNQYSNWSVKCGPESGIIAFDIDPRNGGERDAFDFPPTLEYKTGGEGWRLIYEYPDFEIAGNPKFGEGIELIVNGFITLPPSNHKFGSYRWINDLPIAKITPEFIALGNKPKNKNGGYILADQIFEGDRDINAFKFASKLRAIGLEKEEIYSVLFSVNENRFNPPLDEKTIIEKVESACKYDIGEDQAGVYDTEESNSKTSESYKRWSVSELLDTEFPETKWCIPDLIPEGLTIVGGRPKTGKSWIILQAAISVSTGGVFLGKQIEKGKVLYVSFEDSPKRLQDRIRKLSIPRNADITLINNWKPLHEGGMEDLGIEIERFDYRMVIFDTLSRAFPGLSQTNNPEKITQYLGDLQTLAINKPVSLVFIDHTRKLGNGYPDPIEDIMNTTGKSAAPDCILGLYKNRGKKGAQLLGRGKDVPEVELDMVWDRNTWCWQLDESLTENQDELVQLLDESGEKMKVSTIANMIGKDISNTRKRLNELFNDGLLTLLKKPVH